MRVLGAIVVGCALLIAGIAQLNTCAQEGKLLTLANGRQVPMKCSWTAQAELVAERLLAAEGLHTQRLGVLDEPQPSLPV